MGLLEQMHDLAPQMTAWRRDLHRHPELSFEEHRTSAFVAEQLQGFGLKPETGIGRTGVVAVVEGKAPGPAIALRADMDALPMDEEAAHDWRSTHPGAAHACGHDGHTAALLGAARHLALHPPAKGRVVLLFQPAEENGLGAQAMLDDGLLRRFPFDEVYAFHNMPLFRAGSAAVRTGPTMNGYIVFAIDIEGVGGHGAAFFKATDPLQAAARLAVEISSIVGRYVDPGESALITLGALQAGSSHNIIPAESHLRGTLRALKPEVMELLWRRLEIACNGIAAMTGCTIHCRRTAEVPPCINDEGAASHVAAAATAVLGREGLILDHAPLPFTDDFALFQQQVPGAYFFLGQESAMCHNPAFDFDDALLPKAAAIFVELVRQRLG